MLEPIIPDVIPEEKKPIEKPNDNVDWEDEDEDYDED